LHYVKITDEKSLVVVAVSHLGWVKVVISFGKLKDALLPMVFQQIKK